MSLKRHSVKRKAPKKGLLKGVVPHRLPDARSSIGIDFSPEKLVHKKKAAFQLPSYLGGRKV